MRRRISIALAIAVVLLFAVLAQSPGTGQTSTSTSTRNSVINQPPPNQRGPRIDTLRRKVTRSPAAQLLEMTVGPTWGSDIWTGIASPDDIEEMDRQGKTVTSRSGLQYCRFAMNMRIHPLDDVNFRHALAHLVPKERIIGTLFKYVVVKADTPVPPGQGYWYNNLVDPHPYSPSEAEAILGDAGYQKIGGEWYEKDGSTFPDLRLYVPLEVVSPTSYTVGRLTVEECQGIGLNNVVLTPMDFNTYMNKVFDEWDFEIAWMCHSLTRFPTHLWKQYHSSNNYLGSENPHGMVYPDLDTQLDILWKGLDHAAKVVATREAQKLLMGGTVSDQLPHNVQPLDPRYQALPAIPVYSRNFYDAQQSDLRGAVNMFGYGIENVWTYMDIYWNTGPDEYRPGTTERTVVYVEPDYPERLSQLYGSTVYAWDYMEYSFDNLLATSPYTHRDEEWLATNWYYASAPGGGMDITFDLRLTDAHGQPVKWQDNKPVSVYDVKFAWDFLKYWQIPKYWSSMQYYDPDNTVILDSDTIRAHMTTTSQWLIYDLAYNAYLLPPQVWSNNPYTGAPWSSMSEIIAFDPSEYSYPLSGNYVDGYWPGTPPPGLPSTWDDPGSDSVTTQMFGTGPFELMHSTSQINLIYGYGDLAANRNYWMTTQDIQNKIEYMFWRAGDAVDDDEVDVDDLALISKWWYETVPPAPPEADITGEAGGPPDGVVDIDDLATVGKYLGETETVPYELPPETVAPTPEIYVDPPSVIGVPPGDTFTVNIMITGAQNLYAWKAELHFAKYMSVLEVVDAVEGDFLMAGGSTAFYMSSVDSFHGIVKLQSCLIGDVPEGVYGDGWLATVAFRVLAEGESPLDLQKTILKDPDLNHLPHSSVDGYFYNIEVRDLAILDVQPVKRVAVTKYLYVDGFTPVYTDWSTIGASPWLDAVDDGNYVEEDTHCDLMGVFNFQDIALGPYDQITKVRLEGYTRADSTEIDIDAYDQAFTWLGSLWGETSWSWKSPRWETRPVSELVPSTKTEAGLNAFGAVVHYYSPYGGSLGYADVDALRLAVDVLQAFEVTEAYPTWVDPLEILVVVENQGTATESFDVTAYADADVIGTKLVELTAGSRTTVSFDWDLSEVELGKYKIKAEAEILNGESDPADNAFIDGDVRIKKPGNANGDKQVDALDIYALGKAYGSSPGQSNWNPQADMNGDLVVDAADLAICNGSYGQSD